MATRTTTGRAVLKRVRKGQVEAEKVLARGYKATLKALPPGPRKAVQGVADQLEVAADELTRRGKQTLHAVEKRGKTLAGGAEKAVAGLERRRRSLFAQAERLVADLDRRRGRALQAAEKRIAAALHRVERGAARLEQRVAAAIRPLAKRLDLAAQSEIDRLTKRVAQLERKLARRVKLAA